MTQAVLNTQLYQKMFAEQEQFKEELMQLPPGEILQKAYEYVCREDILLSGTPWKPMPMKWYGLFFCPEGCKVIRSAIHPTGNHRKSAAGGLADLSESL